MQVIESAKGGGGKIIFSLFFQLIFPVAHHAQSSTRATAHSATMFTDRFETLINCTKASITVIISTTTCWKTTFKLE